MTHYIYPQPLVQATLIQRYKRFLADVTLDTGQIETVHCANSGAMLGLTTPGACVWLCPKDTPGKTRFTWEATQVGDHLVGVNTQRPNQWTKLALDSKLLPAVAAYDTWRAEVKYGQNSRVDFVLRTPGAPDCYLEVKNVHYQQGTKALFPDSVTARGTKHLHELMTMVDQGHRAVILFMVQRPDCDAVGFAQGIDATYAKTAVLAAQKGVEFYALTCHLNTYGMTFGSLLPIHWTER